MIRARLPTLSHSVLARRSFAISSRVMSEGDTGATRAGGHGAEYVLGRELMANGA